MVTAIKKISFKYWVEATVFAILCLRFVSVMPGPNALRSGYILYPYLMSYERFGFGSRFLIGSTIQLLTDYVSLKLIYIIIFAAAMVFFGLIALLAGRTVWYAAENLRVPLLAFIAVWLCSPFATQFMNGATYGRMELFLQIIMLVMILCLKHRYLKWAIPVLALVSVAIYQMFVFLYCVPLLVMILFKAVNSTGRSIKRNYIILLVITFVLSSVVFCLFQFNKNITADSPQAMISEIREYSDLDKDTAYGLNTPLDREYFSNMSEHFHIYFLDSHQYDVYFARFILSAIFFSPIIALFVLFWRSCVQAESVRRRQWAYRFAAMSPIASLPAFVLTIDYGRWIAAIAFMQFILLLFLISEKEHAAEHTLNEIYSIVFHKHKIAYVVSLIYLMSLGQIYEVGVLTIISRTLRVASEILDMIGGFI